MKRIILLSLTVAGGLYAQTSSPGGQDRENKPQHRSKLESKTSTKPCSNKSLMYLS
ncbi:hypothetical protein [Mucilaginibacter limnophilus]|uniref:hypothetical protein n=1 Tax=Mucilaginibacter limnophilus TaxID=1932778 RepID=UPI0013E397F8|nr:hypothetical protein [Mucilaginibacter limnophilus]